MATIDAPTTGGTRGCIPRGRADAWDAQQFLALLSHEAETWRTHKLRVGRTTQLLRLDAMLREEEQRRELCELVGVDPGEDQTHDITVEWFKSIDDATVDGEKLRDSLLPGYSAMLWRLGNKRAAKRALAAFHESEEFWGQSLRTSDDAPIQSWLSAVPEAQSVSADRGRRDARPSTSRRRSHGQSGRRNSDDPHQSGDDDPPGDRPPFPAGVAPSGDSDLNIVWRTALGRFETMAEFAELGTLCTIRVEWLGDAA